MSDKEIKLYDPRILNKCIERKCPLKSNQNEAEFVHFEYYGELKDIKVVFVGEAPSKIDAELKRPFCPDTLSGKIIRSILVELNLKNYAFANIICCRPIINITKKYSVFHNVSTLSSEDYEFIVKNRIPTKKESDYCSAHLNLFLNNINEKSIIFLLGKTAIVAILNKITGYIDKCKTVASMVESKPITYCKRLFIPCYDPHYIASRGGIKSKEYQEYLERFKRVINKYND